MSGYSDWGWDAPKEQLQEIYNRAATEVFMWSTAKRVGGAPYRPTDKFKTERLLRSLYCRLFGHRLRWHWQGTKRDTNHMKHPIRWRISQCTRCLATERWEA